jgi:homoserine kinase
MMSLTNHSVTVRCPGTIANLVCGFDVLGLCLNAPYDLMHVKLLNERKIIINATKGYDLPLDPEHNTAGAPLLAMLEEIPESIGFEISFE